MEINKTQSSWRHKIGENKTKCDHREMEEKTEANFKKTNRMSPPWRHELDGIKLYTKKLAKLTSSCSRIKWNAVQLDKIVSLCRYEVD
jgi:hypothetical protein